MQERRPIYEAVADTVIDVNNKEPEEIVSEVIASLA
jgi:shikimate kinase